MPGYTYTDSDTVKNRFQVKDHLELERLEAPYVEARWLELQDGQGPDGAFDAEHLKTLHRHLFQDVYEWAGHTRDERVRLSDGAIASEPNMRKPGGDAFLIGPLIPTALDRIADDLRKADFLCGLAPESFAERAADVMAAINAAHAFREGNGRTQRAFMREVAKGAGHDLDFFAITKERMIQASIAANENAEPGMMRRLFKDAVIPERRAALLKAITSLDEAGFSWNDRYIATAEPEHPIELTLAGIAGEQFMGRTRDAIIIGRTVDLPNPPPARYEKFKLDPGPWRVPEDEPDITRDRGRGGRER